MAFYVSSLYQFDGNYDYFVYVIDVSPKQVHSNWINENLHPLAKSFGPNAVLVSGSSNLSTELYNFLSENLPSDYGKVEALLHSVTCVLVSKGNLTITQSPIYLIPVATKEETEAAQNLIATLINEIAKALKGGNFEEVTLFQDAQKLQLKTVGSNLLICTLRNLNEIFELNPKIFGVGVNLNKVIEKLLPPETRSI